ncbi:hypothetical protein QRX50_30940 [Amycolatopsis carbonis]|uniref:Uncharacterized protein n=1 Tax=Amycolatopsis carbonis TaxID=715471 RepID=A0A9Y2MUP0_9PSEU|nr:hypothetical protein [Amycolatopsis sp. 2-15]WIX75882.1 hypothetical protein QRX50_30940 [Amycolatopsis sp. 2-15]
MTAATLNEVLHIRDHGAPGDMQAYERQYGVLAEGDVRGWGKSDQVVKVSGADFERVWVPARRALDQAGPSAHAGG